MEGGGQHKKESSIRIAPEHPFAKGDMFMSKKLFSLCLLSLLALAGLGGCAAHPVKLDVTIELDADYAKQLADVGRQFQVDFIGLNANQAATWAKKSMTAYW